MYAQLAAAGMSIANSQKGKQGTDLFSVGNTPNIPIYVAPVGLNLGSIIAPATQGSPENGGSGLDYGRYVPVSQTNNAGIIPANFFDFNSAGGYVSVFVLLAVAGYVAYRARG